MALTATIFKAELQIADMDRGYYADHALTVARHPSETDERMMVRLLAFALHAGAGLAFGRGLSADDEPDLWLRDLTGAVGLWIDLGQPDERRLRRACGRAERVLVYAYGGQASTLWWERVRGEVERCANLAVVQLPQAACRELAALAQRTMRLNCTVQEGQVWFGDGTASVLLEPLTLKAAA